MIVHLMCIVLLLIELVGSTDKSFDDAAAVPKLRKWNREPKELHSAVINFKELRESENIVQDEPSSLESLKKMNSIIVQVIKDAAAQTGALHEVKRSKRKAKSSFAREYQAQRKFYCRKLSKALRENNEERKSAFKFIEVFWNENFLPLRDFIRNSKINS